MRRQVAIHIDVLDWLHVSLVPLDKHKQAVKMIGAYVSGLVGGRWECYLGARLWMGRKLRLRLQIGRRRWELRHDF